MTLSAVQAEAAWLATSAADGLPNLLAANGGPFDIVQAYWRRTPGKGKRALYLFQSELVDQRTSMQHGITTHKFTARIEWPISSSSQTAETAQLQLEQAITAVIGRVRGFPTDHTHGGAFLSVAEGATAEDQDARIAVTFEDPEASLPPNGSGVFRADITYTADDQERIT